MPNDLVTTKQACATLGIPFQTLDMWLRLGKVPYTRLAHYRLVSLDTIREYRCQREASRQKRGA